MYQQGAPMFFRFPDTVSEAEMKSWAERVFTCSVRLGDLVGVVSYAPPGRPARPANELTEIFPASNGTIVTTDLPVLSSLMEGMVLTNV